MVDFCQFCSAAHSFILHCEQTKRKNVRPRSRYSARSEKCEKCQRREVYAEQKDELIPMATQQRTKSFYCHANRFICGDKWHYHFSCCRNENTNYFHMFVCMPPFINLFILFRREKSFKNIAGQLQLFRNRCGNVQAKPDFRWASVWRQIFRPHSTFSQSFDSLDSIWFDFLHSLPNLFIRTNCYQFMAS